MADIITIGNRSAWKTECRVKLIGKNDANVLPEDTLTALLDRAERLIKKKVTNWSTILSGGGDDKEYLIDAAISQLCAMLCTPLRNQIPISENYGNTQTVSDYTVRKDIDWDKLETDLYGEVNMFLSQISAFSATTVTRAGVISRDPAMFEDLDV